MVMKFYYCSIKDASLILIYEETKLIQVKKLTAEMRPEEFFLLFTPSQIQLCD